VTNNDAQFQNSNFEFGITPILYTQLFQTKTAHKWTAPSLTTVLNLAQKFSGVTE